MRWKLLIITSLVAALLSAGGGLSLMHWMQEATNLEDALRILSIAIYGIPLVFITLAAVFVYRHTARRRKLQVLVCVLLSITLTVTAFYVAIRLLDRPAPARIRQTN